jgi:putative Mn2+ efflux pump MntP
MGVIIGHVFGAKFKNKAEIFGGAVLVLLGIKILLEHLGVISF